jgi:DnaJ like chaperone protein
MNWWGKLVGTGVGMLAGPIGAMAGAAIGHLYDDKTVPKNEQQARILYLAYFFSCAGKIAKADGVISESEIKVTQSLIDRLKLNKKTSDFAKNVFRKSKVSKRHIEKDYHELGQLIKYDITVGQSFLGGLFEIVQSNGKTFNRNQLLLLFLGEEKLKLPAGTIKSWTKGGYSPPHPNHINTSNYTITLEESFETLGLPSNSSNEEIKKAYREKASHFHPDKLSSKNLPSEFLDFANSQLARINQAFEEIKKKRPTL